MAESIGFDMKEEYIKKQPVFSELSEEETRVLSTLLAEKHFRAGDTIVTQGESVDSVYLIVSGIAKVIHISINNNGLPEVEQLAQLQKGDAIGLHETGFYSLSGIRTATVVADTDMVCLRLSVAAFHGFALAYPHVNEIMHKNAETILGENRK